MRPWEKDGYRSSFDGGMQENLNGIIAHFANASLKSLRNQHAFAALKDICRRFWREDKEPPEPRGFRFCKGTFPEDVITKVIQAAFLWKDQSFFEDAAENHRGNLSLDFFSWARLQFAAGDHAFDNIKNGYDPTPLLDIMLIMQFVARRLGVLRALEAQCSSHGICSSNRPIVGRCSRLDR